MGGWRGELAGGEGRGAGDEGEEECGESRPALAAALQASTVPHLPAKTPLPLCLTVNQPQWEADLEPVEEGAVRAALNIPEPKAAPAWEEPEVGAALCCLLFEGRAQHPADGSGTGGGEGQLNTLCTQLQHVE